MNEKDGVKRLTPSERALLRLNRKVLKPNGRFEPPDISWAELQQMLNDAFKESGRRITNLDELARLAELEDCQKKMTETYV